MAFDMRHSNRHVFECRLVSAGNRQMKNCWSGNLHCSNCNFLNLGKFRSLELVQDCNMQLLKSQFCIELENLTGFWSYYWGKTSGITGRYDGPVSHAIFFVLIKIIITHFMHSLSKRFSATFYWQMNWDYWNISLTG